MTAEALTYVRITDGGFPRLITRQQAADEVNSAASGPLRDKVVQMSAAGTGANLTYADGSKVEIREATKEELARPVAVGGAFTAHIPAAAGRTFCGKTYVLVVLPPESFNGACRACTRAAVPFHEVSEAAKSPTHRVMSDERFWA